MQVLTDTSLSRSPSSSGRVKLHQAIVAGTTGYNNTTMARGACSSSLSKGLGVREAPHLTFLYFYIQEEKEKHGKGTQEW